MARNPWISQGVPTRAMRGLGGRSYCFRCGATGSVIEAMGAGRRAARSMKNYLRIRDYGVDDASEAGVGTFFGIDLRERNYARIRVA